MSLSCICNALAVKLVEAQPAGFNTTFCFPLFSLQARSQLSEQTSAGFGVSLKEAEQPKTSADSKSHRTPKQAGVETKVELTQREQPGGLGRSQGARDKSCLPSTSPRREAKGACLPSPSLAAANMPRRREQSPEGQGWSCRS